MRRRLSAAVAASSAVLALAAVPVAQAGATTPSGVAASRAAHSRVCHDPDFVLRGNAARGLGIYYAMGNVWNPSHRIRQRMGVCSAHRWYVRAKVPNHADRAVLSYPNIHRDYHDWGTGHEPRIRSFRTIHSRFAEHSPGRGIYDVAYDIWINGIGDDDRNSVELMIWTDNHGQVPAGSRHGTARVSGHRWRLWTTRDNRYVAFVAPRPVHSARLHLKGFMTYLMRHHRLGRNATLGQVGYGVEIVQTGGQWRRFDVTRFSVTSSH